VPAPELRGADSWVGMAGALKAAAVVR